LAQLFGGALAIGDITKDHRTSENRSVVVANRRSRSFGPSLIPSLTKEPGGFHVFTTRGANQRPIGTTDQLAVGVVEQFEMRRPLIQWQRPNLTYEDSFGSGLISSSFFCLSQTMTASAIEVSNDRNKRVCR